MAKRLFYIPLEPYRSRYTEYTSGRDGVYETCFREEGIEVVSLRPITDQAVFDVQHGRVVDYVRRSEYAFNQVLTLIKLLSSGMLNPEDDAVYFDDFWTPGFEMWPYSQSIQFGSPIHHHVPTYSFCYAQSTDPFDFTAPMHWWMRPMELGWTNAQRAVMCASQEMFNQWTLGGLPTKKLRWCGLPYHGRRVLEQAKVDPPDSSIERKRQVVFSSRFDAEKNPSFLFELARRMPDVPFIVSSGLTADRFKETAACSLDRVPSNVEIRVEQSKKGYFELLQESKVQFNCASQDFVSFTLLDATLNGCAPLYPNTLTFPDALNHQATNLYGALEFDMHYSNDREYALSDAQAKLEVLLSADQRDYSWVYRKYDLSVTRMLQAMQFDTKRTPAPMDKLCAETDLNVLADMLAREEEF